jgi:hypothetical protein
MDTTAGLNASRDAETTVQGILIVVQNRGKGERIKAGGIFILRNSVLACSPTPGNLCTNELQPDSVHQIGVKQTIRAILTAGESGSRGDEKAGGIFQFLKLGMFLLATQQPAVL